MLIGFSTGALYKSKLSLKEKLALYEELDCRAVELNYIRIEDLLAVNVASFPVEELSSFEWVSLHAPVKINYGATDSPTQEIFAKIEEVHKVRPLNLVVFHPETVVDFEPFKNAGFPVAFENMDNRKDSHRSAEDLAKVLSLDDKFRFVLDVNHAYTNDKTMKLASELYKRAGHRLSEIHLSGYSTYHEPLHATRQLQIIHAIRDFETPIIIESVLSPETLGAELQYIFQTIEWLRK